MKAQLWMVGLLFLGVYSIIMADKMHRTVVALIGACILLFLGVLNQEEALRFIDFNTIGLLTGMMIIVGIARKSGVFEYLAILAVHRTNGSAIRILIVLSTVTALLSALLDNVTTVLLIIPVTLSICQELGINPLPYFSAEIMASNIGGTATLIGDPPNIMIGSAANLGFTDFLINLTPVIIVIFVVTMAIFWLLYRKELSASDENLERIRALNPAEFILDKRLMVQSLWITSLVIVGFVINRQLGVQTATIALFGAVLLLQVSGAEPDQVFHAVEWETLFFFIGLFIMVGGLVKVGIINALALWAVAITHGSLTAAALVVLWVSALASAFIDNIPFVAAFIPLIKDMGQMGHSSVLPLWWALSLGACLGGNGTLIGASANVVVSGIAARHGFPMSFKDYLKLAFPLMLVAIVISTVYLLVFCL